MRGNLEDDDSDDDFLGVKDFDEDSSGGTNPSESGSSEVDERSGLSSEDCSGESCFFGDGFLGDGFLTFTTGLATGSIGIMNRSGSFYVAAGFY